jgi:Ca2+-binding RTX toxin-like protein
MAYDVDSGTLSSSLTNSHSTALTQSVIDQILAVVGTGQVTIDQFVVSSNTTVTVPAGTEVGFFHTDDATVNSLNIENPPPVIILQTSAGVEVLVNTGTGTSSTYVIVGSAGNDNIVITGTSNTDISLGTGNSTVLGGQGSDTIHAGSGNETVGGGGGNDVLIINGGSSDWLIGTGSTVTAGTSGLHPQATDTDHVILTNATTGQTIDFTGIQYVALDNSDAIVIASSTVEAGVASLYHAAFGRTGEAGGMGFWFDYAKEGLSLHDIAYGFTQSPEYAPIAAMSDSDFVTQLYTNTFGRAPDSGGMAYWLQQLASGATRVDLLTQFASVAVWNEEGAIHTEVSVVGTVIIDSHIV